MGEEPIMIGSEPLVACFMELAAIDSPSQQEAAAGEWVSGRLHELGATVETDTLGNVLGRLEGQGQPLLLSAHLDTVTPAEGVRPLLADGVIRSDGRTVLGADDKAGVAIILEVVRTAQQRGLPLPPLEILFSVQEEIGLRGAKAFDTARLRAREGIGLDSGGPPGTVVISAPSQDILEVVVHGVAAHAGSEPEKGISAIRVASEAISAMPLGRIDGETTANIGVISGGRATNIVCDRVEVRGEARSRDAAKLAAQTRAMVAAFEAAAERHGTRADVQVAHEYSGYAYTPEEPILRLLAAGAARVGLVPQYVASGGGSDANVFNAAGIRITNMSIGMEQVHTTHERIAVADMVRAAEWLLACLRLRAG